MRLGDYCFARDLPWHLYSGRMAILHPGHVLNTLFSLPRLDAVGPQDQTDGNEKLPGQAQSQEGTQYGVHFASVLLSCQIIAGNAFGTAYLSHDGKGEKRVQLSGNGILTHEYYFLHVPQGKLPPLLIHLLPCPCPCHPHVCSFLTLLQRAARTLGHTP